MQVVDEKLIPYNGKFSQVQIFAEILLPLQKEFSQF